MGCCPVLITSCSGIQTHLVLGCRDVSLPAVNTEEKKGNFPLLSPSSSILCIFFCYTSANCHICSETSRHPLADKLQRQPGPAACGELGPARAGWICRLSSWQVLNKAFLRGDDARTDWVRKTGTHMLAFKQEE